MDLGGKYQPNSRGCHCNFLIILTAINFHVSEKKLKFSKCPSLGTNHQIKMRKCNNHSQLDPIVLFFSAW